MVQIFLSNWAAAAEKQIGEGPFFGGPKLQVVDLKLHMAVRWFIGGKLDYIPTSIFAEFQGLNRVYQAVLDDARVKAWNARN